MRTKEVTQVLKSQGWTVFPRPVLQKETTMDRNPVAELVDKLIEVGCDIRAIGAVG
ncbi:MULTISPECIES: hypothetical protein [Agrobacterium]|uniref:hypothetical protein n=1 Tax=Agrobacterium TaxID=357 RepID=UPI0009CA3050|nr:MULTISPECIES: hypothetical protein [Agrobacterium]CUX66806.1 hypothetical protein AGR6A_Lc70024 [Agrobacterium sp. NCPPB 925]